MTCAIAMNINVTRVELCQFDSVWCMSPAQAIKRRKMLVDIQCRCIHVTFKKRCKTSLWGIKRRGLSPSLGELPSLIQSGSVTASRRKNNCEFDLRCNHDRNYVVKGPDFHKTSQGEKRLLQQRAICSSSDEVIHWIHYTWENNQVHDTEVEYLFQKHTCMRVGFVLFLKLLKFHEHRQSTEVKGTKIKRCNKIKVYWIPWLQGCKVSNFILFL